MRAWTAVSNLFVLGLCSTATAADVVQRPYTKAPPPIVPVAYQWSGLYFGANVGSGRSHKCWDTISVLGIAAPSATPEGCNDGIGATAGGQIGYRWQSAPWVFGVEAQGNWADVTGSNVSVRALGLTNRSQIEAFGLLTGQIGYSWSNVLLYAKAGAAVTKDKYNGFISGTEIGLDNSLEARWGAVVGAGIEFGLAPNWSIALQYDHLFMGRRNIGFTSSTAPQFSTRVDTIRQDVDTATVRFNYRWGTPAVPKY